MVLSDPDGQGDLTSGMTSGTPGSGSFDPLRPPSADTIQDCVHCGFCLPACPTYALWGEEMDSPRGRIYLMKLATDGAVPLDDTFVGHMDACLGCMACVTACPSGVKYDELIDAVRPQIERNATRSIPDRLFRAVIFALFPYPSRLRPAALAGAMYQRLGLRRLAGRFGLLDRLPARLASMEALLPPVRLRAAMARQPVFTPAAGVSRHRVGLLTGCVQRVFFADVNAAATRVLAADGCDVVAPRGQRCCGALSGHAGREAEAMDRARALIDAFAAAEVDTVVVTVAGCGSAMKDYGRLLREDPDYAARAADFSATVRDVTEFLAEIEPVAPRHAVPATVAYHDACHLAHAQGIREQPRAVLRAIPGLAVRDIPESGMCCGSAGIYNLVQPEAAAELGRRKADHIASVPADAVVTANAGCLLQIRRYLGEQTPVLHPVQVIDAAIRGVDPLTRGG